MLKQTVKLYLGSFLPYGATIYYILSSTITFEFSVELWSFLQASKSCHNFVCFKNKLFGHSFTGRFAVGGILKQRDNFKVLKKKLNTVRLF